MASSDDGIFVLGNYKLIEVLGIGAMGYVYRARQLNLDRDVAVKILSPKLAVETGYTDLFIREARMAASLEHPNIVPVFDYGFEYDVSYVAMRLLLGGSLDERIQFRQKHNLALPSLFEIVSILTQAASALDYAHARGVIHRDIKPTNLMFDQHGTLYIVDFGIAKLVGTTTSKGATFLGTPSFMAPEQWEGKAPSPAVDQYALGAAIYMMITGHPPFESDVALALMSKHLRETPKDVQFYRPHLPAEINGVLQTALAKQPEDRYPTVMAFAQAFAQAIHGTAAEAPTEFTTYVLPQPSFSFPFPTPTRPLAALALTQSDPTPVLVPVTASLGQGRSFVIWVESGLLLVAIMLIVLLISQRSDLASPPPTSVVELVSAQDLSATPSDDPTSPATHESNVALLSAEFTFTPSDSPTRLFTATSSSVPAVAIDPSETQPPSSTPTSRPSATPTSTSTSTPTLTETPTFTPMLTETPSFTPTFTPTLTETPPFTPSSTPTQTETPTETPTSTPTTVLARPNVHWNAGTPLKISNSNGAWLRSRASTSGRQVATLAYNNPVTSTGRYYFDGRQWWWEVKASWGAVGWVEQYSLVQN